MVFADWLGRVWSCSIPTVSGFSFFFVAEENTVMEDTFCTVTHAHMHTPRERTKLR